VEEKPTYEDDRQREVTPIAWAIKSLAAHLSVSPSFLRLEIARGNLHPTRLGRRILVRDSEVRRYLAEGSQKSEN